MFKRIKERASLKLPIWLLISLVGVFLARIPSLFEPYYYGDEMIYLTLGNAIRHGLVLYKDVHDNKTPLIYFVAALSGNMFWFRAILCIWMIATILLFWKLTQSLFPKKQSVQKIATIVFAIITSLPTLEGQIANAELFLIGPLILGAIFILKKENVYKNILLAGVCIGVATLFKVPAIFDAGAFVLYILLSTKLNIKSIKQKLLQLIILMVGIFIPITLTFAWYWMRGALNEYVAAAFLQNLGYVASQRTGSVINSVPFLVKNGPILIRGAIVGIGLLILFILRNKLSKPYILGAAWLLTSLFAASLSERPYPHYMVQVIPSFTILLGILFSINLREQSLAVIPLTLAFIVPVYYKFWYYPTVPYFTNFITLLESNSKSNYFSKFGKSVIPNYEIAKEVQATVSESDPIFIWGDAPPIYALSKNDSAIKYVANYHIADYSSPEEAVSLLSKNPPKLIVIEDKDHFPPVLFSFVKSRYHYIQTVSDAEFWYNMVDDSKE